MSTLARLQPGMRVVFDCAPHRVVMVNECRARIIPERRVTKTIVPKTGAHAGQPVQIQVTGDGHNISPNAELPILSPKS